MERIYKGEIQRLFPIFEAIKEGKTIQWLDMGLWRDIDGDDEGFFLDTLIGKADGYRIKPEVKFRPFANAEECWQEMLKHQPFGWIKCKEGYFNIVYVDDYYVGFADKDNSSILLASKNSYQDNTFKDGTPFGVKVEEDYNGIK